MNRLSGMLLKDGELIMPETKWNMYTFIRSGQLNDIVTEELTPAGWKISGDQFTKTAIIKRTDNSGEQYVGTGEYPRDAFMNAYSEWRKDHG